jgi:hypothetical protein
MTAPTKADTANEVVAWYAMPVDEVVKTLATGIQKGLSATEASSRLEKCGPNRLPEGKKRGPFVRFISQFNNILVFVLLGAGFIKLMLSLWVDASIIFGVVVLNALLGFVQEGKAERALDSIRNMLSAEARTIRDGDTRMISAEELVPGDVVLLESGDKVPADLRLADAKNFRTEEAALTGESVPAEKSTDAVSENATVGDRESMAFSGTMVVSGRATGLVVATGSETELGRINQLLTGVSALETPLLRQIKKFGYRGDRGRPGVRVWKVGEGHRIRRALSGRGRHCSFNDPGRPACTYHDNIGNRRAANGATQRDHSQAAGGGNTRLGIAYLLRQDRYPDAHGDDGRFRCNGGIDLSDNRQRLRPGGRGQEGRTANQKGCSPRAYGSGLHAV